MSIDRTQSRFVLAEMMNSLNYFSALFGQYPYPVFRGAVHPFGFGQGLATLLMIPPTDRATGNDKAFFDMMRSFVATDRDQSATTDQFTETANAAFATTPVARRFGVQDLNWFFRQRLFQTARPSYRLEYALEAQPDKTYILKGTVFQEGLPEGEKWFMPLPLVLKFGGGKRARAGLRAGAEDRDRAQAPVQAGRRPSGSRPVGGVGEDEGGEEVGRQRDASPRRR